MHFFNPVPVMKLVEVVSGLRTTSEVADTIFGLARRWGKTPVHARSTPGFIVNRIARPYYGEALALLQERAVTPPVLDACLRAAGFRMGPCELMDLIGHDTNFAVTEWVYEANFGDKRYAPSLVQRELLDGDLLGRKSGRGFYDYRGTTSAAIDMSPPASEAPSPAPPHDALVLHGNTPLVEYWARALTRNGMKFSHEDGSNWIGLQVDSAQLRLTDGRPATRVSAETGVRDVALMDLPISGAAPGNALAFTVADTATPPWVETAAAWLRLLGFTPKRIGDAAGLIVARTIAMLINEAADAVQQGVCSPDAADTAMKLGVNYPAGPFEWLSQWDARAVVRILDHLDEQYRGERYRVSPELRQQAWTAAV
jgi:3-hydroxybutyryl-CoA dehydrogenase